MARKRISDDVPGGIQYHNLRALLFWASIGVGKSRGGSYAFATESPNDMGTIVSLAEHIGFQLPNRPRFGELLKKKS